MKKVLVTGGTGFIGSHLVNHLLSMGMEVLVLDKSIYKPTFCDISGATIIEGDVLSHELLHEYLAGVDTCFHLAALSSVVACSKDWIFSHENNVLAFNGLLEEIRRIGHPIKLVYASSAAVYGNNNHLPLNEMERAIPSSTYGADKLSNELYAKVVHNLYGIPSIGLRFFNVFGPGQLRSNPYSGVITSFKLAIQAGGPIKIYGDGGHSRDFIYIKDVVDALVAAAQTPYEQVGVYNICRGQEISIQALAETMMRISGLSVPIRYEKARPDDLCHSLGDPTLATQELGFTAQTQMEKGLKIYLNDNSFNY